MRTEVKKEIKNILSRDFILEKPKDINYGHYATPIAFSLAKELRKSPIKIAEDLCQKFSASKIFSETSALKGYINFKLSDYFLNELATKAIKDGNNFAKGQNKESLLIEYVSANPTGPLHIGHARGAVLGDTLCRVGKHLGYDVKSEYYVNDAGNQIYLLGLSIWLSGRKKINLEVTMPEEYYRGDYIDDLADLALDEFTKSIFLNEDEIQTLSKWATEKMLNLIKDNLSSIGISFDYFVSEKELYSKWNQSFDKLHKSNKTYEKDGKIWIKSTDLNDELDRVIVREDKRPTYLAGDIIYHDYKFQRHFDKYINIWGADHHGYIARVKAAINFLGYDEQKLEVILAQMVSLLKGGEPFKMSKRAGNFILLSDVVEEIGSDALRFIFLSKKADTHLEFDIDSLKVSDSSNPVYYVNYAHARINQVFAKSEKTIDDIINVKLENLNDDAKNLLFNALLLPEILDDAFETRNLQKITDYLKNLSAIFHKFYNEYKVINTEFENMYLKIFATVSISIKTALDLIGIKAKDKM